MTDLPFWLEATIAAATVSGFVFAAFDALERLVEPSSLDRVGRWLLSKNVPVKWLRWQSQASSLLDEVFGPRWFSSRAVLFYSLTSLWAATSITIAQHILGVTTFVATPKENGWDGFFIWLFGLWLPLVLVPGVVSVAQTRLFIRWMARQASLPRVAALLFADAVANAALFLLAYLLLFEPASIAAASVVNCFHKGSGVCSADELVHLVVYGFTRVKVISWPVFEGSQLNAVFLTEEMSPFFWSSFGGSFWLWLYGLSAAGVRVFWRVEWVKDRFSGALHQHPFRVVGLAAAVAVFFLVLASLVVG
jgi:hypothetical protein